MSAGFNTPCCSVSLSVCHFFLAFSFLILFSVGIIILAYLNKMLFDET